MARVIFNGANSAIHADDETGFRTGASITTAKWLGKVNSASLTFDNSLQTSQGIGEGLNLSNVKEGLFTAGVSINGEVVSFSKFARMFGTSTGDDDDGTITESDSIDYSTGRVTSTVELGNSDGSGQIFDVTGCVWQSLSFEGTRGSPVSFSIGMTGASVLRSTGSSVGYAYGTQTPFMAHSATLKNGSDSINIRSFSWSVNNEGSALIYDINSRLASYWQTGNRRYNFTYTLVYDTNSAANTIDGSELISYFFGSSSADAPITTLDPTALDLVLEISEGAVAGDRTVLLQLDDCFLTNWSHPVAVGDGTTEITVSGIALSGKSDTGLKPITWSTAT